MFNVSSVQENVSLPMEKEDFVGTGKTEEEHYILLSMVDLPSSISVQLKKLLFITSSQVISGSASPVQVVI